MICMRCFGSMGSIGESAPRSLYLAFEATSSFANLLSSRRIPDSPKCRMIPVKDRPQHEKMECPIDGLIKANGGRRQPEEAKRKKSTAKPRATKNSGGGAVAKGKKRKAVSSDEESEMTELSDDDFSD